MFNCAHCKKETEYSLCDDCELLFELEKISYCGRCTLFFINEIMYECIDCEIKYCIDCIITCTDCKKKNICGGCVIQWGVCGDCANILLKTVI